MACQIPANWRSRRFGLDYLGPREYCDRVLCVSLRAVDTGVLLEVLLRNSVEGECGNRTLQARSCHTPCAVGAAPAAEVVAVDPDQVFVHTSAFARVMGLELGLRWVGHQASEAPPSPWVISHEITERPSTKGAPQQPRPKGHVGGVQVPGLTRPGRGVGVALIREKGARGERALG
jgi:hypothetical protein